MIHTIKAGRGTIAQFFYQNQRVDRRDRVRSSGRSVEKNKIFTTVTAAHTPHLSARTETT